ncbi:uncharacterized protein [Macrobrachium rosenbergii]|uniref:uncharacterized protein isoform X2 n=1 Tax=Macrobrachium rosenbergii TaxID=79674 RepID=UPI0034D7AEB5
MQDEMDAELTCPVCQEIYTKDLREPVLLPGCGHTFCRTCLCSVETSGKVLCPTCRKRHIGSPMSSLPTIYALLSLSEKYKKPLNSEAPCLHHGSPLEFWCRRCQEALCGHCLLAGHLREGHVVEKGSVFVAEKKEEIVNSIAHLVNEVEMKKELIIKQMGELINQIALNTEESQILHDSKTEAENILKDIPNVNCIDSALTSQVLVNSLQMGTQKIPLSRTKMSDSSFCDKCKPCPDMEAESHPVRLESCTSVEEDAEDNREGMHTEPHSPLEKEANESFKYQVNETTDKYLGESINLGNVAGDVSERNSLVCSKNENLIQSNLIALRTKAPWPLRCYVVGNDGRTGKLKWENDKLHMYSLSRAQNDAQFMIQLSVVEWLISAESPEVFLDLGSDQHYLGRVYIRLYGHLRRAQHFLALCLGSLGPSYKFSKFHGVAKRGAPGETLAGGKYITSENTISIQGLIPGLEWGGHHISEKRAGLVVGASGGRPTEDAFFHICTKDHIGRKFACVFGEVVSEMQVLRDAVYHMLQSDVQITDVGVILSQGI